MLDPRLLAEERSLAYHRAVAERLEGQPELVERARRQVRAWRSRGQVPFYVARWEHVLSLPVAELAAALVADTEEARALRQSTPFAGALPARERWGLWREVRDRMMRT